MGYEVLTAFFLEAGFLGVMLFGLHRVGPKLHFLATFMVAFGTLISATWILAVNSWMQTPAGFGMNEAGQFIPLDWWKVIFNPSFPYRLVHMVLAAYLTTAFVVGAVGAWHLLKNTAPRRSRTMFSMAMWMATIVAPIQIMAGDFHGLNTLEHQPVKVMAMEGHFDSHPDGAPLILFGIPNTAEKRIDYAIEIPKFSSLILKHDLNAPLAGLDTIPDNLEPPVAVIFWSFRVMVGIGFAMLGIGLWSLWCRYQGHARQQRLAASGCRTDGTSRFRRRARRLDHHRSRPPALYDLRPPADRRLDLADCSPRRRCLADRLHHRLLPRLRRRHLLHPAADEAAAARSDARSRRRTDQRPRASCPAPRPDTPMGAHIMAIDLPFIWAAIIAFAVLAYVILDGFDLGIGILFPFFPEKRDRDVMMNSVAPVWDGNETWLVLGGGGLLAVFPLAYSVILSALYAPIIAMVLGLVFRGVAFEYRWRTKRGEFLWNWAFAGGSMVAAFAQGVALGALVQGIPVANRAYAGAWWDWLTPFSIATGFAILIGYALLGSTWLIMKTTGELAEKARRIALRTCFATIAAMGIVSLWTPFLEPIYLERWFSWPTAIFSIIVPVLVLGCFALLLTGIRGKRDVAAVSGSTRPVRPRLCRHRHQLLSLYGAALGDHLGCSSTGFEPCLPVVGCRLPRADHPDLHRLCLLGVPRKD